MFLTKDQTIQIHINNAKAEAFKNRYKFTTKYRWYCLECKTVIYVSYKQYGRNSIFCDICYKKLAGKETIIQYQYMRVLKEKQMQLIESFLKEK